MKQHSVVLGAVLFTIASAALAQTPERQHALVAPADQLARELLLSISPLFTEVERPTYVGLGGPDSAISGVHFATAAHSAGYPGLCKATVAYVRAGSSVGPDEAATPIESWPAFKVVGDTTPLPDLWNDAYEKALEAKCRSAGRVLPATTDSFADPVFFTSHSAEGTEAYDAYVASRALQLAIQAAPGTPLPQCSNDPRIELKCSDASSTLHKLNLSQIREITSQPCADDAKVSCVSATFFQSAYWNEVSYWLVDLRIQPPADDAMAVFDSEVKPRPLVVLEIKLRPEVVTYD